MITKNNFSLLDGKALLNFVLRLLALFNDKATFNDSYGFTQLVNRVQNAYNAFLKAFERDIKNPLIVLLAAKDLLRDNAFLAFRSYLEACSYRADEGWHDAANTLMDMIRKYSWSAQMEGYKAETSILNSIVDECEQKYPELITLLKAEDWLANLKTHQAAFAEVHNQVLTTSNSSDPNQVDTRPELMVAVRKLLNMVDIQSDNNSDNSELSALLNAVNQLIAEVMTTARAAQTRRENSKGKAASANTEQTA